MAGKENTRSQDCKEQNLPINGNFSSLSESQKNFSNWKQISKNSWNSNPNKGWNLTANSAEIWNSGFQGIQATSGDYILELDAKKGDTADAISQTVKTVPRNTYFLSFDLRQRRNTPEEVIVEWNDGEKTYQLGNPKTTAKGEWEQQTFAFTATTDQATITLREPSGSVNDSFGILLDNIRLIEDCNQQTGNVNTTASIKVLKDDGREFSDDDKNKGIQGKNDYLSYVITLNKRTSSTSSLQFKQQSTNTGRDVDSNDIDIDNTEFFVDDTKNTEFQLNGQILSIPEGVKTFEARIPIIDDTIIEGTEQLRLQIGDGDNQKATAKIQDNDFAKLESFTLNSKDAAEINQAAENDPNKGTYEDYFLYTVKLKNPTKQSQKFKFSQALDADLPENERAQKEDFFILENGRLEAKFEITNFDGSIPGAPISPQISNPNSGEIWVPIGVKEFEVKLPIFDDSLHEEEEQFTLEIAGQSQTGTIHDNDLAPKPLDPKVKLIRTKNAREGRKQDLKYEIIFDKVAEEAFELSFTVPEAIEGKDVALGEKEGRAVFDYFRGKKAIGLTENVENNEDGTVTVPKGVKSFIANVPVVDDDIVEPTEVAILRVGDKEGIAQIFDNDEATTVESIIASDATEGDDETMDFTITLNRVAPQAKRFSYFLGGDAIGGTSELPHIDYLEGRNAKSEANITVSSSTTLDPENRTIRVKKGVQSFNLSIPIVDDLEVENPENILLQIGSTDGYGVIFDNDTPEQITSVPEVLSISSNTVEEGEKDESGNDKKLTYTVKLSEETTEQTTFLFNVSNESTAVGAAVDIPNIVDYLTGPKTIFSDKKISATRKANNSGGVVTIPRGISEFTVEVPVIDDTLIEDTEFAILEIGDARGTGIILDNDSLSKEDYPVQAISINPTSVKEGDQDQDGNQKPLEYKITLNQATTDKDRVLKFSVNPPIDDSIAIGGLTDDKQTVDYLNSSNVAFSGFNEEGNKVDGTFELKEGDELTLPTGIRSFVASVPVIDDTRIEKTETATLNVGDLQGIGQIFDNDSEVKAVKITPSSVVEGNGNPLNYEVTLNQRTTQDTLIRFSVDTSRANTAIGAPTYTPNEVDYLNGSANITLSNGVTNNGNGTVTVPKGVTSFTASVPVIDDTLVEKTETAVLNIGELEGIGEIFDNDSQTLITNPEVVSIGASSVLEGDGNRLTYTITFNTALFEETKLGFSVRGTATGAPTDTPNVVDYLNGATNVIFTEGVSLANGSATIPKGVSSFTASVPVIDDTLPEDTETAILKIGNLEGVGQIFDNDTVNPAVEALSIKATSVQEGDGRNLVYTVLLNRTTTANTNLAFSVDGDAIGAATDTPNQVDYLNGANVTLSNSVVNNGNGTVTIPTGVSSFTATVQVIDDTLVESTEEAILKIGTLEGVGQIFDNDSKPLDLSVVSVYADAVKEGDGRNLTYTVQLNRQTTESSNFSFSVSGDAIGATADKPNEVDYLTGTSNVTLSNGATSNGSGTITIPAGVISFTASVPVIDDTLVEDTETAVLSIGNLQGTGQIFDNDTGAEPVSITASSVTEGDGQNLTYTVALGQATTQATEISFSVAGDAIGAEADTPNEVDYLNGSANVTLSDGVTNNGNGTVTVPKGITSFTASVPVIDDTLPEDTEKAILKIGKLEGIGQIFDNDQTIDPIASDTVPQIKLIQTNAVLEGDGNDLVYKVKLDQKPEKKLKFAFNIGGDATFDLDYETGKNVTLTNGVKNKKPGSITIPAGVKSFKAKVPVIDDNLIEETETASIHFGRVSGIGQIFDNDSLKQEPDQPQQGTNPNPENQGDSGKNASLALTNNGNGLEVKGAKGSNAWVELKVSSANDIMQNNLVVVNRNGDGLGTLGSTPKPLQNLGSSFRGTKHLLLKAGDEIYFRQASDNEAINEFPLFELDKLGSKGFQLRLEDNRPDGGKDFNDLIVNIQTIQQPKDQDLVEMASIQRRTHDGLFDLSDLNKQTTLTLKTLNNTGGDVLIGLVPVTGSQGAGFTVDGKDPRDGRRFDKAVRDSLINPEDGASQTKGKTITERWSLNSSDAGLYAPVLITEDDQVMTFGRRFGSTSDQRLKVLGENVVGFELSAKNNGPNQEWHYDDVIVKASLG